MDKELITINIGNVADGAMVEAFELELTKVLKNIMDPSTKATATRRITLELEIFPREDRIQLDTKFRCSAKLAGLIATTSRMFIGRDADGGLVPLADDPRQMNIFTPPKPAELPKPIEFKPASGS